MRRREFITLLGGAAARPLAAHAQQRMRRIGVLMSAAADDPQARRSCRGCNNWAGPSDARWAAADRARLR